MNITREQFKKLAKKHLIALQGYDVNETIEIFGVEKLYDEMVESGIGGVNGSLPSDDRIVAVILKFEQIGQEEFKTIPYAKRFMASDKMGDILKWVKSIDPNKSIADVYFNDRGK